jgi:hypothetical protein
MGTYLGDLVMTGKRSVGFRRAASLGVLTAMLIGSTAHADSGFYIGGSLGDASIESIDIRFDEEDSAWKAFGGYIVDMPVIDFGIEAGFVDFGAASATILAQEFEVDVTALSAFAMVGVDWGLFGLFAKAGLVSWNTDTSIAGLQESADGSDSAYGVGFRLNFSSVEIRAEYEEFDIEDIDTLDMVSVGILWRF